MLVPRSALITATAATALLTVFGVAAPALADIASPLGIHTVAEPDTSTDSTDSTTTATSDADAKALITQSQARARSAAERLGVIASGIEQFSAAAALAAEAAGKAAKDATAAADEAENADSPAKAATSAAKAARAGLTDEDLDKAAALGGAAATAKQNADAGDNITAALVASANAALAADELADDPTNVKLADVAAETENEAVAACQKAFNGNPATEKIPTIEEIKAAASE